MSTVVVAGRVDEDVKREVDRVLERAGKTSADVIRDVWVTISLTGKLPSTQEQEDAFKEKRRRFQEFMAFVSSAPPIPEWAVNLTDDDWRDMMVEDMLEEERHFVGGDLYVPPVD